jgi:hypothetical protein
MNYFKAIYKLYLYNKKLKSYKLWINDADKYITSRFKDLSIHSSFNQRHFTIYKLGNKNLFSFYYIKGNIDSDIIFINQNIEKIFIKFPSLRFVNFCLKRVVRGTNKYIKIK